MLHTLCLGLVGVNVSLPSPGAARSGIDFHGATQQPTAMLPRRQSSRKFTVSDEGVATSASQVVTGNDTGVRVVVEAGMARSPRFVSPTGDLAYPGNRVHAIAASLPLVDGALNLADGLISRRQLSPSRVSEIPQVCGHCPPQPFVQQLDSMVTLCSASGCGFGSCQIFHRQLVGRVLVEGFCFKTAVSWR